MIIRELGISVSQDFFKGKAIVLLGARQVGKSTLLRQILKSEDDVLWLDAENPDVHQIFAQATADRLKAFISTNRFLVIDEAQKVDQIGSKLKLLTDYLPEIQVIATGSSAFELRNQLNEPLTGRKYEHQLFPISFQEMVQHTSLLQEKRMLPHRLVFGYYPEVVSKPSEQERTLRLIADSYLYKDLLLYKGIRKPEKLFELLKALAWQLGNEVNYYELGNMISLKSETVEDYIHLLEQSFIIYRLPSYHTNQRTELKKAKKVYFNDLGIRNAIINDFKPFEVRQDQGALFENFVVNEFRKQNEYHQQFKKFYFWRTQNQQEVDLIAEKNGEIQAFEIKWNAKAKLKSTRAFSNQYPDCSVNFINSDNFFEFLVF